jgi:hypothetical protein
MATITNIDYKKTKKLLSSMKNQLSGVIAGCKTFEEKEEMVSAYNDLVNALTEGASPQEIKEAVMQDMSTSANEAIRNYDQLIKDKDAQSK